MNKSDWLSERIIFGLILILGYFATVGLTMLLPLMTDAKQAAAVQAATAEAKDALLVIGPLLGVIVQSIWKSDKTDRQASEAISSLARAAEASAGGSSPQSSTPGENK